MKNFIENFIETVKMNDEACRLIERDLVFEKYYKEIPVELRNTIKYLKSNWHWAIYVALLKNERIYYYDLLRMFDVTSDEIDNILKDLGCAGITFRHSKPNDLFDKSKHFYELTKFGERFARAILDSFYNITND